MVAAAHTFLSFSLPPRLLVSPSSTLRSSFGGISLNLHRRQCVSFSASSKKSLTVVSAAKEAIAVLKGNSDVEGVVTLTQEDTAILALENACMEFDDLNLKPTFKILWGVPGRPNAINIAERLGLPCDIINSARGLYGSASAEINEVILAVPVLSLERLEARKKNGLLSTAPKALNRIEGRNFVYEVDGRKLMLLPLPLKAGTAYLTWNGTSKIIRGF
ncbi:hypothetical protein Bca4012_005754 [Brassica carinata]|uniref:Uncharacterized protein n=1 Tax=Brassica carinata TaxID=52824 RepID=A0A8X7RS32_BRACI|nr:hypothetical protein Bca52824_039924 [Brassica carinata]